MQQSDVIWSAWREGSMLPWHRNTSMHTHTLIIYPFMLSIRTNEKVILIASQLSELACVGPLQAWWRDASHLGCRAASHTMSTKPFLSSSEEECGAQVDRGTDVVQVRRSVPTEGTWTENILGGK